VTSFALSLLHNLDATIMILIWNPRHGSLDRRNGQCDRPAIAGMGCLPHYAAAPGAAIKTAVNLPLQLAIASEAVKRGRALPGQTLDNGGHITSMSWMENDQCIAVAR
jgi:hypothetical protein